MKHKIPLTTSNWDACAAIFLDITWSSGKIPFFRHKIAYLAIA